MKMLNVSTPGRICLFGEHQDYLGLPVIAAAISKRVTIDGFYINDSLIKIKLPDINTEECFNINDKINYEIDRDYFKSAFNVMKRKGFTFSKGIECEVKGNIPINAGASSSTALIVSWISFLGKMSDQSITLPLSEIAHLAWEAEVAEFNEPGGKMDHYSTTYGGISFIEFSPEFKLHRINPNLSTFILGDSKEPKDTKGILSRVKNGVLLIVEKLKKIDNNFTLRNISENELKNYKSVLDEQEQKLLYGTIVNRDLTQKALNELNKDKIDHKLIGELLNNHHQILDEVLDISTIKINNMLKSALDAGAYGGKINGSGGGGTMFVYAPDNTENVLKVLNGITDSYIITIDQGVKINSELVK